MEIKRRPFQGVLNILSFNRHYYLFGVGALILLFVSSVFISWPPGLFRIIIAAFGYGFIMPLVVSAYVYDFSGYYDLHWINELTKTYPDASRIVNITAGFDETSYLLKDKFPRAILAAFDFYNPIRHTEAAIRRARKVSPGFPDTRLVASDSLPVEDQSVEIVFLLSAVHEIRSNDEKVLFLKECRRICTATGKVVLVEHLRDFPNFVAFSIGFTHFFSRKTWKTAFRHAGFTTCTERKFTPFMSVFECTP